MTRVALLDEIGRLRDALDAANERIANFERHVEREIEPKLLARAEAAEAERDRLREALRENVSDAYNLLTQGESPTQRRQPSARRIYDRAVAALAAGTKGEG
jgi:hypothetical protein